MKFAIVGFLSLASAWNEREIDLPPQYVKEDQWDEMLDTIDREFGQAYSKSTQNMLFTEAGPS